RGAPGPDAAHRLLGRLWALERMFYYIYGGWGQGLEMNDFPPSVKYLFAKQIVDESTHEMLYMDAMLKKGCIANQKAAFGHPYSKFAVNSSLAYYVFSLRNLATYPHTIRIAALNLGPKILEQGWMEELAEAAGDPELKGAFASQAVENRSHVNMGRRIVEEFVAKPVEAELARWAVDIARPRLSPLSPGSRRFRARPPGDASAGAARPGDGLTAMLKVDHERCTECRMCYIVCRELDINAVYVAHDPLHRIEIDPEACTYPGCTACLMYCPAAGSIVELDSGRSVVPPPPEAWRSEA